MARGSTVMMLGVYGEVIDLGRHRWGGDQLSIFLYQVSRITHSVGYLDGGMGRMKMRRFFMVFSNRSTIFTGDDTVYRVIFCILPYVTISLHVMAQNGQLLSNQQM